MRIPFYQVNAFTRTPFHGNPAAVCVLDDWLPEERMQTIAAENGLSETAFLIEREQACYDLRWFTPVTEVPLCGHATLASAYVVLHDLHPDWAAVQFSTRSGILTVIQEGELFAMNFPALPASPCSAPDDLIRGLGAAPQEILVASKYLVVYDSEATVRSLTPDMQALRATGRGVIVTAQSQEFDFVSRMFAPLVGVPEDPVTGSAHCTLVPYWAARLQKTRLHAYQASARGGDIFCEDLGDRVKLSGYAVAYLEGTLIV